jgi:S-adenosylmethionine:tRNA ribosyltransferase-isomerase
LDLSSFDYPLPPELIAQQPPASRDGARMLVLDRATQSWQDRHFLDLPTYLSSDDTLVLNNSAVFPSRLLGHRPGLTGKIEVFLVRALNPQQTDWLALVKPGKKLPPGAEVEFSENFRAQILDRTETGERLVRLLASDPWAAIQSHGHIPLPPYIRRPDSDADAERYQTVYSQQAGSVAAPTAGLHFTPRVLDAVRTAGAQIAQITLHVGLGTFQPLQSQTIEENKLHQERFFVPEPAADQIHNAQRLLAVGTTSVRTVESFVRRGNAGETDLFIYPGFAFQRVNRILTNFHLPQSSLLLLIAAFAGTDFTLAAYRYAVEQKYRFFSYGDCMLIL